MDPLSLATGVVTLLGACSVVTKTFRRILSLKDAPPLIQALNNEISDLQLALMDVNDYVQQIKQSRASTPIADARILRMCSLTIDDTREKIQEIDSLLHSRLLKPSSGGKLEIKYPSLVREFSHLIKHQGDIRHSRQRILSVLSHISMKRTSAIEVFMKDSHHIISQVQTEMLNSVAALSGGQVRVEKSLENIFRSHSGLGRAIGSPPPSRPQDTPSIASPHGGIEVLVTRISHVHTKNRCSCRQQHQASIHLQTYLGRLFIGYSATPYFNHRQLSCLREPRTDLFLTYVFPFWFLCYALLFRLRYSRLELITFSLSLIQVVPWNHVVFTFFGTGDINGLKKLLLSGQVSLRAQSVIGTSLLWVGCP